MNKKLKKYLQTRAVQGPWRLINATRSDFNAAIVIPALAEAESLPQTLASLAKNPSEYLQRTQIIIVLNNREDCDAEELQDNQRTLRWLQTDPHPELNLAWIDASSPGFELPAKEGIGLARKIGFDLALPQLDRQQQPLLISLDADTLVDENYLPAISAHFSKSNCGGATLPFRHQIACDQQQEKAIRFYELYLRSYLFGLQLAGSPYAYHSIGSAFACRAETYIAAGGMNRRSAAEDFYFLQQLAKTASVEMLCGTLVRPSPRISNRVPFGTGRAVAGQVEADRQLFHFSSVTAFKALQQWLALIPAALEQPGEDILLTGERISPTLKGFLEELNFASVWRRLQQNHTQPQRLLQAFHGWFDALRTRQLLARLDAESEQSAEKLVTDLLAWGGYQEIERLEEQLELLEQLQGVAKK